jgi:hypothetical protein
MLDQGFNLPTGIPEAAPDPDFPRETPPVPEGGQAIDERLRADNGRFLAQLQTDLRIDLDHAIGAKGALDSRVERWRTIFAVDRDPPVDDAPNHRVPYARGKVSGATAHFRQALDLDPFFVARPYTREGSEHKPVWETAMERELDRSHTRRQLWHGIQESCLTGTGVMQLSVMQPFGEYIIQGRAVRLEDFYVTPTGAEDVGRVSTFLRYYEPFHIMRQRVTAKEYDAERVESLRPRVTTKPANFDERREGTHASPTLGENTPYELFECYYRWGHEDLGEDSFTLWRVVFSHEGNEVLYARPSPYLAAFDAPPYVPLRVMPRLGYFYGESYMQVLDGVQHVMDWAFNSLIAYDQFALTPPTFVDMDSELYALVKDVGIRAGQLIPVRGDPKQSVYSLPTPTAREPYQLLIALRSLGDDATFPDHQLNGIPTATVRTATEINMMGNAAQVNLGEDLASLADDLSLFARMYWALMYEFKIKPKGVLPVSKGSDQYLIAARELDGEELAKHLLDFMQIEGDAPQEIDMARAQLDQAGVELFIASARRDDIEWLPNGAKLVSDKLMHANKMERLIGGLLPVLSVARQDRAAWHILKEYLIALDLHNWEDFLPSQPPEGDIGPEEMAMFAQQMQQMRQGGGVG